jgi:hypothetical protein
MEFVQVVERQAEESLPVPPLGLRGGEGFALG